MINKDIRIPNVPSTGQNVFNPRPPVGGYNEPPTTLSCMASPHRAVPCTIPQVPAKLSPIGPLVSRPSPKSRCGGKRGWCDGWAGAGSPTNSREKQGDDAATGDKGKVCTFMIGADCIHQLVPWHL